ncbi:hypothetical protein BD779DRAFT_1472365 [Infundibulicybe gibba]|nr:hypothetical protein BD779DRAFT_1472365 [Infundibulicybe gibba]
MTHTILPDCTMLIAATTTQDDLISLVRSRSWLNHVTPEFPTYYSTVPGPIKGSPDAVFQDEIPRRPNQLLAFVRPVRPHVQVTRATTNTPVPQEVPTGGGLPNPRGNGGGNADHLSSMDGAPIPQPREAGHDAAVVDIPHGNSVGAWCFALLDEFTQSEMCKAEPCGRPDPHEGQRQIYHQRPVTVNDAGLCYCHGQRRISTQSFQMIVQPLLQHSVFSVLILSFVQAQGTWPGSVPLAIRSPHFNCWLPGRGWGVGPPSGTAGCVHFQSSFVSRIHPPPQILGWIGAIRIDGVAWVWLGEVTNGTTLVKTEITPTRTILTLAAGPMELEVTFLSPIEPTDLVRQSFPFTYMYLTANATDGASHSVQLYTDITAGWHPFSILKSRPTDFLRMGVRRPENQCHLEHHASDDLIYHQVRRESPSPMQEINNQAEDATVYYAMANVGSLDDVDPSNIAFLESQCDLADWRLYVQESLHERSGRLLNTEDKDFRAISDDWPIFAFSVDLGNITEISTPVVWALGVVRNPTIRYASGDGTTQLRSSFFWTQYSTIGDAIGAFIKDFPNARQRAIELDQRITSDALSISQDYADLVSLSVRQTMGGFDITTSKGPDGQWNTSDVMMFMKSVGDTSWYFNTRRVNPTEFMFAAFPAYLYLNASWAGFLLRPSLQQQATTLPMSTYAMPDLGSIYPVVLGNNSATNTEALSIESSGNMIIMALTHAKASGDESLISSYYRSDGKNNPNLAIKGIIGIRAMGEISRIVGHADDASRFEDQASIMLEDGGIGRFYRTTSPPLMLDFITQKIYDDQTEFYAMQILAAGKYGIEYDSSIPSQAKSRRRQTTVPGWPCVAGASRAWLNTSTLEFPTDYNTVSGWLQGLVGDLGCDVCISSTQLAGSKHPGTRPRWCWGGNSKRAGPKHNIGAIIGGTLAGFAIISLFGLCLLWKCRQKHKAQTFTPRLNPFYLHLDASAAGGPSSPYPLRKGDQNLHNQSTVDLPNPDVPVSSTSESRDVAFAYLLPWNSPNPKSNRAPGPEPHKGLQLLSRQNSKQRWLHSSPKTRLPSRRISDTSSALGLGCPRWRWCREGAPRSPQIEVHGEVVRFGPWFPLDPGYPSINFRLPRLGEALGPLPSRYPHPGYKDLLSTSLVTVCKDAAAPVWSYTARNIYIPLGNIPLDDCRYSKNCSLPFIQAQAWPGAVPLVIRSPHFNSWLPSPGTQQWPTFWNGNHVLGWMSYIRIDGVIWEWLGPEGHSGNLTKTEITPTRTILTFMAGSMEVEVTFLSPIEPTDLVRQSFPFTYIYLTAKATDGASHSVQVYSDISAGWHAFFLIKFGSLTSLRMGCPETWGTKLPGALCQGTIWSFHQVQRASPESMQEINDQAEDATIYFAMANGPNVTWQTGPPNTRDSFTSNHTGGLSNTEDNNFRAISDNWPSLLCHGSWNALGVVRDPTICYGLGDGNIQLRSSFFWTQYKTIGDAIGAFVKDFPNACQRAIELDQKITSDALSISQDYADLVSLSARQTESQSHGIDVRGLPAYLYLNASWAGLLLKSSLQQQAVTIPLSTYAILNLGLAYPSALGNTSVATTEVLAIESSSDMIIMTLAYAQASGDVSMLSSYYTLLKNWANYLAVNSLNQTTLWVSLSIWTNAELSPDLSVSSDGQNNPNLTIKGIIGIRAMGEISQIIGQTDDASRFKDRASTMLHDWENRTILSNHITSTYGQSASWGLIYNLFPDRLLKLNFINQTIYNNQTAFYAAQIPTAGKYGILYDSNIPDQVKSHWTMLTAATTTDNSTRDDLVSLLHSRAWLNNLTSEFSTDYSAMSGAVTGTGGRSSNSPAQGAMFAFLALNTWLTSGRSLPAQVIPMSSGGGKSKLNIGAIVGGTRYQKRRALMPAPGLVPFSSYSHISSAGSGDITKFGGGRPAVIPNDSPAPGSRSASAAELLNPEEPEFLLNGGPALRDLNMRTLPPPAASPGHTAPMPLSNFDPSQTDVTRRLRDEVEILRSEMAEMKAQRMYDAGEVPPQYN